MVVFVDVETTGAHPFSALEADLGKVTGVIEMPFHLLKTLMKLFWSHSVLIGNFQSC